MHFGAQFGKFTFHIENTTKTKHAFFHIYHIFYIRIALKSITLRLTFDIDLLAIKEIITRQKLFVEFVPFLRLRTLHKRS